jgi:hypothetical protein
LLEAASGFLATRAIAGGGQNRPADCLQSHLAASAYLGEVFLLFLVHCDRPFVDPVYEVILALVRNVRNGSWLRENAEIEFANGNFVSTSINLKTKALATVAGRSE